MVFKFHQIAMKFENFHAIFEWFKFTTINENNNITEMEKHTVQLFLFYCKNPFDV